MNASNQSPVANSQVTPGKFHRPKAGDQTAAFIWPVTPEPIKTLTKEQREKAYQRQYAKSKYVPAAVRNAAVIAFKKVAIPLGNLTETPESKAKTAKLLGRNNGRRTQ